MKIIEVSEATTIQLDWLVAKCQSIDVKMNVSLPSYPYLMLRDGMSGNFVEQEDGGTAYSPTTDWAQGGPIIDSENIDLIPSLNGDFWAAKILRGFLLATYCPTRLIAAMRCYVISKLGKSVEVPEELS